MYIYIALQGYPTVHYSPYIVLQTHDCTFQYLRLSILGRSMRAPSIQMLGRSSMACHIDISSPRASIHSTGLLWLKPASTQWEDVWDCLVGVNEKGQIVLVTVAQWVVHLTHNWLAVSSRPNKGSYCFLEHFF